MVHATVAGYDPEVTRLHDVDDSLRWPPWGCRVVALAPQVRHRESKPDAVAVLGLFLAYDATVTGGVSVAPFKLNQGSLEIDQVVATTTIRTREESFHWRRRSGRRRTS